jgi:chromosomal replication initiator protein
MNPGSPSYNPLFIYGGVGLGKTHLIQGIAHEVKRIHPDKRFVYVSSEQFLHLFVTSLGRQNVDEFRRIYRDIDLLLMDDVQFLGGKTQTQEELFHRFNDLYQTGRQIVFTSDRLPGEITGLEERLVSRFQSGLVADIQPPDYETRMAILELKVRDEGEFFPSEVLDFIASTIRSNVRQLEGAVHRLAASSRINGAPIDLTLTKRVLTDAFGSSAQRLSAGSITAAVAEAFAVSPSQLRGKQRRRDILIPRQVAMFLIREMTESSLVEIGRFFSGRDHSTVLNSIDRIRQLSSEDPSLRRRILDLRTRLSG